MSIDNLAINTLRVLSSEMVDKANSGHPGLPLGAAPMAYTLFDKVMKHNPKNPNWVNRDRFILSAGHGSALLYSLLHVFGYGLTTEDLKGFRQFNSLTPGHPEYGHTVGVEATTGPLGQGLSNAVGMAMAEAHLAATFNTDKYKLIDHYTYTLVGDGCLMEGITNEASSLAGTLGLDKLIVLYDSNNITIEGDTRIAFRESVSDRYRALGWDVHFVADGNDIEAIQGAIALAKENKTQPSLVEIKTKIGFGSSLAGSEKSHGAPLGKEGTQILKENLGFKYQEEFFVPDEVKAHVFQTLRRLEEVEDSWNKLFEEYKKDHPEKAKLLAVYLNKEVPVDYLESEEYYDFAKTMASRASSGEALNRIADKVGHLFGGSADLAPSNNSIIKSAGDFSRADYSGRNVHFGVREHAMGAIANGLALHGGITPYVATFFVFADYMKPAIRMSSLMRLPVVYVFTHDSIGVGEDGPTHQPIDQMAMLRSIPGVVNFRPADARETAAAWSYAVQSKDHPVTLALTRQNLNPIPGTGKDAFKGAYVLKDFKEDFEVILIATGSEVELAYKAAEELLKKDIGARVVSMPSMDLFEMQSEAYKEEVLPKSVRARVGIEAYNDLGWGRYIGLDGKMIAMEGFGASAPADKLFEHFGFTVENVVQTVQGLLEK
jgi:transketolase